ncbi:MAG: hypothetical protein IJ782_01375, partial [Prevotella sp.]|nr:hypothetical protein [Prevotella sp.]
ATRYFTQSLNPHLYISGLSDECNSRYFFKGLAERFLSVVGATYIYSGSNNRRESAGTLLPRLVT